MYTSTSGNTSIANKHDIVIKEEGLASNNGPCWSYSSKEHPKCYTHCKTTQNMQVKGSSATAAHPSGSAMTAAAASAVTLIFPKCKVPSCEHVTQDEALRVRESCKSMLPRATFCSCCDAEILRLSEENINPTNQLHECLTTPCKN